ncbi:MAG TPA: hypothetical protein VLS96_07335, partial [Nodosilinea sp.]|nr:hypothetical protein [Nodosilinea sp.]
MGRRGILPVVGGAIALGLLLSSLLGLPVGLALAAPAPAAATASATADPLLQPAPTQPLGYYDHFGELLTPEVARDRVVAAGLNPADPASFLRIGAVEITPDLVGQGRDIFFNRGVGDMFGLQQVFGFKSGVFSLLPEYILAVLRQGFRPTTNLTIYPLRTIRLGDQALRPGIPVSTGLDLTRHGLSFRSLGDLVQSFLPIGLKLSGNITCAVCHASLDSRGSVVDGIPNGDLNVRLLIALAPNGASGFARIALDPLAPELQGNGKTILDSQGRPVTLPDPRKLEFAFDSAVMRVPQGNFESNPDRVNNTTQIPSVFTFQNQPFGFGGNFAVGPWGGLSAINNAVHSSEVNLLAAAQESDLRLGIDPEVYLGIALQNAFDKRLRLPPGDPVTPSVWLRQIAPELTQAELEDQIPAPGTGTYPFLRPSLFTFNGLVFTPNTNQKNDIASGPFLFANNAMAAWQSSLVPPPNRTAANQQALASGSVSRGARVFEQANCATCHIPPFYTDNVIHPIPEIGTNPARGKSGLGLPQFLVPPQLYSFDTPVPPPASATVLDVPTEGIAQTPTTLPDGLLPDGGYKTLSLRGLAFSPPYLHDGGVAVGPGALAVAADGSFEVINPARLGLAPTLSVGILPDAASSLRAMVDRTLRAQVIAANQADPGLVSSNLDGTGHEFYVDAAAGYTAQEQADLVNYLMALDDNP